MQAEKIKSSCNKYNKWNEYVQGLCPEQIYIQFQPHLSKLDPSTIYIFDHIISR